LNDACLRENREDDERNVASQADNAGDAEWYHLRHAQGSGAKIDADAEYAIGDSEEVIATR